MNKGDTIRAAVLVLPYASATAVCAAHEDLMAVGRIQKLLNVNSPCPAAFRSRLVGVGLEAITSAALVELKPSRTIDEIDAIDLVYLPALNPDSCWLDGSPRFDARLLGWLRRMYEGGAVIASICTGSYILAEAGLLEGRPATTHWALERHMSESYPQVQVMSRKPMVITGEGGRLVMSGTGMYQTNLTLYVIQRFLGVEATHDYARASGKFWSADSDDVYARSAQRWNASDGLMREVQEWFARNLVQASPVTAAAKVFGLSERTLTRRFKQATGVSPVEYLQQIRIETARCLLERDRRSIEQIAAEIGYADVSYFSRLFKKLVGLTPGQYRRRFQLPPVRAVDHVSRPADPPRN